MDAPVLDPCRLSVLDSSSIEAVGHGIRQALLTASGLFGPLSTTDLHLRGIRTLQAWDFLDGEGLAGSDGCAPGFHIFGAAELDPSGFLLLDSGLDDELSPGALQIFLAVLGRSVANPPRAFGLSEHGCDALLGEMVVASFHIMVNQVECSCVVGVDARLAVWNEAVQPGLPRMPRKVAWLARAPLQVLAEARAGASYKCGEPRFCAIPSASLSDARVCVPPHWRELLELPVGISHDGSHDGAMVMGEEADAVVGASVVGRALLRQDADGYHLHLVRLGLEAVRLEDFPDLVLAVDVAVGFCKPDTKLWRFDQDSLRLCLVVGCTLVQAWGSLRSGPDGPVFVVEGIPLAETVPKGWHTAVLDRIPMTMSALMELEKGSSIPLSGPPTGRVQLLHEGVNAGWGRLVLDRGLPAVRI